MESWRLLRRPVSLAIILALFCAARAVADDGLWLGMLREDDIVAPIALLRNGEWSRPWPDDPVAAQAAPDADGKFAGALPLSRIPAGWLAQQALPSHWLLISGRHAPRPVGVDRAVEYRTECGYLWGLSDRPAPDPEADHASWPVEKMGFVVSAPVASLPFRELETDSKEASELLSLLAPRLTDLETAAVDQAAAPPPAIPREQAARAGRPLRLLHVYRLAQPVGGARWYVEAEREYAKPPQARDAACATAVVMRAWATVRDARVEVTRGDAVLTDCDMREFHSLRPLAEIMVRDESWMLALGHDWESESYDIFRWSPREVRLVASYNGGGC